ncbi:MarR family transcriptional regulator [Streptococcus iniae]|uniref:MarR family winged helix-turn-helix transcriptional regulator n=1 Tax=Streptococcus iniae TaxID=1346 RepID=UPI00077E07EC|nr:MarR family transcriptional regulator [Streptococcus iniae]
MDQEQIGVLIKRASLTFDRTASQLLKPFDLTPSQFKFLKYVTFQPEASVRQIDLEVFFGMSNPSVTGVLQNLEKKGLISRQNHPDDRRSKVILLTQKAKDARLKILKTYQAIEEAFTSALSEQEITLLRPILRKLTPDEQKSIERENDASY